MKRVKQLVLQNAFVGIAFLALWGGKQAGVDVKLYDVPFFSDPFLFAGTTILVLTLNTYAHIVRPEKREKEKSKTQ